LSCPFGGACLSRPQNQNTLSNVIRRTRQAGPSRRTIGGARLSCPRTWDGLSNEKQRTRQARPSEGEPDKQVPPESQKCSPPYVPPHAGGNAFSLPACGEGWGGAAPPVPDEAGWTIQRGAADATSASLRSQAHPSLLPLPVDPRCISGYATSLYLERSKVEVRIWSRPGDTFV